MCQYLLFALINSGIMLESFSMSLKNKMLQGRLISKKILGTTGIFTIETPDRWSFHPGQYTTIGLETPTGFVVRAYSIANNPESPNLEFYIALVENGKLTPTIFQQEVGSTFWYLKPVGKFVLPPEKKILMVATGTGLAPFLSMLRHLRAIGSDKEVFLMHGVAYEDQFGYEAELESLGCTYLRTCSRSDNLKYGYGRVNELFRYIWDQPLPHARKVRLPQGMDKKSLAGFLDHDTVVMACGNPGMIEDIREPSKVIAARFMEEEYW